MANGTQTLLARQAVAALSFQPSLISDEWIALIQEAGDPASLSFIKAMRKTGHKAPNPIVIAEVMSKNGYAQATPDWVQDEIIIHATKWGDVDLDAAQATLEDHRRRKKTLTLLEQTTADLKLGKITPEEAKSRLGEIELVTSAEVSCSDNWVEEAKLEADRRREMIASKKLFSLPPLMFPTLAKTIPFFEPGTIISLVAHSGVGKSILTSEMMDYVALKVGQNVLNCSTELPGGIMRIRRIAKRTGYAMADLQAGFWDERCAEALREYQGAGKIYDWECAGSSIQQIIAQAERHKAHIFLDYFDMADISKSKMRFGAENQTDMIGYALTAIKEYVQRTRRIAWIVWQVGKEAATKQYDDGQAKQQLLTLNSALNSSKVRHRSNYGLVMNFPIAEVNREVEVPWDKSRRVPERKGEFCALGTLRVDKDSFSGQSGTWAYIFRDGSRSRIAECKVSGILNGEPV